jgi:hypothetical protein
MARVFFIAALFLSGACGDSQTEASPRCSGVNAIGCDATHVCLEVDEGTTTTAKCVSLPHDCRDNECSDDCQVSLELLCPNQKTFEQTNCAAPFSVVCGACYTAGTVCAVGAPAPQCCGACVQDPGFGNGVCQ